jgi:peptidoglycan/LPS O-acetylase OafA/YrhL
MVEGNGALVRPRLRGVDGLRFIAALGVVIFHYTSRESTAWGRPVVKVFPGLENISIYGAMGVFLFFMISGFVILMTAWDRPLRSFVASRASRLFPAYWFAVIATGALAFFDRGSSAGQGWSGYGASGFLINLTMTQTAWNIPNVDGVYWTLWIELLFYLIIAVFVVWGITRTRVLALCAVWPVLAILAQLTNQPLLVAVLQPTYAPFFAIGMLVYLIYRDGPSIVPVLLLLGNWTFAVHVGATYIPTWLESVSAGHASAAVVTIILTGFLAVLLVLTLTRASAVNWRWLTFLGTLTYPLYLLHQEIGFWLISLTPRSWSPWITVTLVVIVMCGAAYLVHLLIERPFGPRMRRAIEGPPRQQPAGAHYR